jgi:flagellar motor switch protein FliN/FliY
MVNAELKQDVIETKPDIAPAGPDQFAALGESAAGRGAGSQAIVEPSMEGITELGAAAGVTDDRQYPHGVESIRPKEFEQLSASAAGSAGRSIDMLLDVSLPISIELGRTSMPIHEILNLAPGSVIELDKLAGEPVDLLVNEKLIARGEVVVVEENFGIRITSMIAPQDRIKNLR